MRASIVIATWVPDVVRLALCRRSFGELLETGVPRDEFEIVVCQNGGLQEDLIARLRPNLLIRYSRNIGTPAAWNAGISAARGDAIFVMDDDLSYQPGWMAYGLGMLDLYPKAIVQLREPIDRVEHRTKAGHLIVHRLGGQYIARRRTFQRVGPFSTDHFRWAGLWERNAARRGHQFVCARVPMIVHLGGEHSMSRSPESWRELNEQQRLVGSLETTSLHADAPDGPV